MVTMVACAAAEQHVDQVVPQQVYEYVLVGHNVACSPATNPPVATYSIVHTFTSPPASSSNHRPY